MRAFRLSRNFGQAAALFAGLRLARGRYICVLDADLQDPPELIEPMLERIHDGCDMVYGQRRTREGESYFKRVTASLFYRVLNLISDYRIPKDTGDFRVMTRRALNAILEIESQRPFNRGLFSWVGFKQEAYSYDRDRRAQGNSKWNLFSLLAYAIDAITSFSVKPLRLASLFSAASVLLAGVVFLYALLSKLCGWDVPGWTSIVAVISIFAAGQFLVLGIMGEYLVRVMAQTSNRPLYFIQDEAG